MEVRDEFIPKDLFTEFIARCPQVCIELLVEDERGVLLAKRTREPAKGEWFWPGSRLYKGERKEDAVYRVAEEELGIEVEIESFVGVYEQFWETSSAKGSPSRHTVNLVYHVVPKQTEPQIILDEQHRAVRFITDIESDFHQYVVHYLRDSDILNNI